MRKMFWAMAWMLICGGSVSDAAPVTSSYSFDFVGQPYSGQGLFAGFTLDERRPLGDATLDLSIRGDYDTANELVNVLFDGVRNNVGQAGTTMQGAFLGTNVTTHGPGDISFDRSLVIDLEDLLSVYNQGSRRTSLRFNRTSNVGGGPTSQISGTLKYAAVPEPSTMVLTSLGLVCAGCCYMRRRRRPVE